MTKRIAIRIAAWTLGPLMLTGAVSCGGQQMSAAEACTKLQEDSAIQEAFQDGDTAAVAKAVRGIADDAEETTSEVFMDAAEAMDYLAENGNEGIAPDSVNDALGRFETTCDKAVAE